jgi:hypothetical protein
MLGIKATRHVKGRTIRVFEHAPEHV